jgi:O-antigen ligase
METLMPASRWITTAERGCLTILFVWLVALPLPFGSIVERAKLPLIAVPLFLCGVAVALRLEAARGRLDDALPPIAWRIWAAGGLLFVALCAVQLIPLPAPLHQALSPESHRIWTGASRVASLAGVPVSASHPLTVDPDATAREFFRMAALLATFCAASLLIRSHERRLLFAGVMCAAALFEAMYGLREAALQRYEIWGWVNRLIFNRVTGTFVNPNHFAHYMAIVLPMPLFLVAVSWRNSGTPDLPFARRVAALMEQRLFRTLIAGLVGIACIASVLLAQSRGALLAISVGLLAVAALLPGQRRRRVALMSFAVIALVVALVMFLGTDRTVRRFLPSQAERETLVGRRIGIAAAMRIWLRFPIAGSGAGTFERVVSLEQDPSVENIFHHAHNDYAEIAATTGTAGAGIAVIAVLAGYVALVRMTFGGSSAELSWRRRAFQAAALASITIAMVHALFDFNFFLPSNPATLAAIAGVAVAGIHQDKRTRR